MASCEAHKVKILGLLKEFDALKESDPEAYEREVELFWSEWNAYKIEKRQSHESEGGFA